MLRSGIVLNVQMVHNASGTHDRVKSIDLEKRTVTLSLLDGFQGGKQFYYHLVTDVSEELPAALENGVHTPRLGKVPGYGLSRPSDRSALLGFSPVVNGITKTMTRQDQGFAASIANGGIDPINIFPIDPDNDSRSESNNYSPLWDAHVSMWTPAAISAGKRATGVSAIVPRGDVPLVSPFHGEMSTTYARRAGHPQPTPHLLCTHA